MFGLCRRLGLLEFKSRSVYLALRGMNVSLTLRSPSPRTLHCCSHDSARFLATCFALLPRTHPLEQASIHTFDGLFLSPLHLACLGDERAFHSTQVGPSHSLPQSARSSIESSPSCTTAHVEVPVNCERMDEVSEGDCSASEDASSGITSISLKRQTSNLEGGSSSTVGSSGSPNRMVYRVAGRPYYHRASESSS